MILLAFAILLFIAVLLSGLVKRSIISTAVLFLVAGMVLGKGGFQLISIQPTEPFIAQFTELALFSVLFTDGMSKGFASIFYGLLSLRWDASEADRISHLLALTIVLSIIAHSSTDVPLARWVQESEQKTHSMAQE